MRLPTRRLPRVLLPALAALSLAGPLEAQMPRERGIADARREPLRLSLAVSRELATYTASNNEFMNGAFRTVSGQVAKPLFRWRGTTFAWLAEVLPVMLVTSEAPPHRYPVQGLDPEASDPARLSRYTRRSGYGFGLAPLGAEATRRLGRETRLIVNVTAGAAWFDQVVPYGRATQANFTVAPGLLVEQSVGRSGALAAGYVMHHLSNASMGGANPGMNSHLLTLRWTR